MLNSKCVKIGLNAGFFQERGLKKCVKYAGFLASLDFTSAIFTYRTRAIIGRSRFEAALVYKLRILSLKNEEFPFLVHKLSAV